MARADDSAQAREREWPGPRAASSSVRTEPIDPRAKSTVEPADAGRFVWPPGRVEVKPAVGGEEAGAARPTGGGREAESRVLAPPRGVIARWWAEIEATWIGLAEPPLYVQATRAGWSPESVGDYCPRCGEDAPPMTATVTGCPSCRERRVAWDRLVRLGRYEPPVEGWVHQIKFRAWRRLGAQVGELLGERLRAAAPAGTRFVVVPVPTSAWRRLARGVDHPLVIARAAAGVLNAPVWAVLRRRHRPTQASLSASARARNVRGTMSVRRGWGVPGWGGRGLLARVAGWEPAEIARTVFVVVDDVATTGATLTEAVRALRKGLKDQGVTAFRVWAGVVAKTVDGKAGGAR